MYVCDLLDWYREDIRIWGHFPRMIDTDSTIYYLLLRAKPVYLILLINNFIAGSNSGNLLHSQCVKHGVLVPAEKISWSFLTLDLHESSHVTQAYIWDAACFVFLSYDRTIGHANALGQMSMYDVVYGQCTKIATRNEVLKKEGNEDTFPGWSKLIPKSTICSYELSQYIRSIHSAIVLVLYCEA